VILFLLFTNDVTICMELDRGIHISSTWFVLETGCDTWPAREPRDALHTAAASKRTNVPASGRAAGARSRGALRRAPPPPPPSIRHPWLRPASRRRIGDNQARTA
jgi:hypothetical protein